MAHKPMKRDVVIKIIISTEDYCLEGVRTRDILLQVNKTSIFFLFFHACALLLSKVR